MPNDIEQGQSVLCVYYGKNVKKINFICIKDL